MKQLLLLCGCSFTLAATAQTSDKSAYKAHAGKHVASNSTKDTRFEATEMAYNEGYISFSNLPEVAKQPWAIITDENGEVVKQSRITNDSNIDVHRFAKGMYFVSLVYRDKTEKAFVLQVN